MYCRFNLDTTDLIFRKDLAKKERIKLVNDNMSLLINYRQIINDKDFYLWMKLAENKEIIINFSNEETQKQWIELMIDKLKSISGTDNISIDILELFERLHWIDINKETELSFKFRISEEKHQKEIKFLINLLSRYSKITQIDGNYYLE